MGATSWHGLQWAATRPPRERDYDPRRSGAVEANLERKARGRAEGLPCDSARLRVRAHDHGIAMPDNPARWDDLKAMGFEPSAKLNRGSHPSLPHERLPMFVADLRARDAIAARALEFLILTNVRTDAVLKARWEELDLAQALWSVALANLKDRKFRKEAFRVPLPSRAVEIARQMQVGRTGRMVFPGQSGDVPLSNK